MKDSTLFASKEAIRRLGVVKADAALSLAEAIERYPGQSAKFVVQRMRKRGTQLSAHEKRIRHLRPNACISEEFLEMLTDLGLEDPVHSVVSTVSLARAIMVSSEPRGRL